MLRLDFFEVCFLAGQVLVDVRDVIVVRFLHVFFVALEIIFGEAVAFSGL